MGWTRVGLDVMWGGGCVWIPEWVGVRGVGLTCVGWTQWGRHVGAGALSVGAEGSGLRGCLVVTSGFAALQVFGVGRGVWGYVWGCLCLRHVLDANVHKDALIELA